MALINFESLKDYSQLKKYESGTVFSRDGVGSKMYVILQGEVALLNSKDNSLIATVGPGDFFDEALVLSDERLPLTSIAVNEVVALPISRLNFVSFISKEPKFTFELMRAMNERSEKLRVDYEKTAGCKWNLGKPAPRSDKQEAEVGLSEQAGEQDSGVPIIATHNEFELLPEGHTGSYELALTNDDTVHMCGIEYKCPICGKKFQGLRILASRLGSATTDDDMRKHYKDIDPTYYQVVTCPHCLYSAQDNMFENPDDPKPELADEIKAVKRSVNFKFGTKPDTATVFAGYYLALYCAPKCFTKYQLIQARLLQKLSWMYHDCGDANMEEELAKQALEKYLRAYSELDLSADSEQQLCMIIGELNLKLGKINEAKDFYYKAKMNSAASAIMRRRAENRLDVIKESEKKK